MKTIRYNAPIRSANEVGAGDHVKIGSQWKQIASNSAAGSERVPRHWSVQTTDGAHHEMFSINRYAKKEDIE